jgi:hypothetical protein
MLEQFQSNDWIPNGQVLWSGMPREKAQEWAKRHELQTLTIVMGPLMDIKHPDCLKLRKNNQQWSNYIHGASAIFAWRIAQGEKVTLLSPPLPERFHPSGLFLLPTHRRSHNPRFTRPERCPKNNNCPPYDQGKQRIFV